MSDPIQVSPPSAVAVLRVAPIRPPEPPVEPPRRPQADNRGTDDYRESQRRASAEAERHMMISRDKNTRAYVYRSVDAESGDVLWQYPAEEMLRLSEYLRQLEDRRREEIAHEVDERA